MRLGREMGNGVRTVVGKYRLDGRTVADVGAHEPVARIVRDRTQRFERARIGKLVEVEDAVLGFADQEAAQRRADETRASGDDDAHSEFSCRLRNTTRGGS